MDTIKTKRSRVIERLVKYNKQLKNNNTEFEKFIEKIATMHPDSNPFDIIREAQNLIKKKTGKNISWYNK